MQDILATAELLLIGTQTCQTHIAIQIDIIQDQSTEDTNTQRCFIVGVPT